MLMYPKFVWCKVSVTLRLCYAYMLRVLNNVIDSIDVKTVDPKSKKTLKRVSF